MSANTLLISDAMIKDRTVLHGNIDPKLIYPDIKAAQDMYIQPVTGSTLYLELQRMIEDGSIKYDPFNERYKSLIDCYIADALMYYTLSELPMTLSYQFWNKGVTRKTSDNTDLPSMGELIDLSNKYKNRAEFYANRLKMYLKQNAEIFPEYLNCSGGLDTIHPEDAAFTMPVWLGDDC